MCTVILHVPVTISPAISIMNNDYHRHNPFVDAKSILLHSTHVIIRRNSRSNAYMQPHLFASHSYPRKPAKPLALLLADTDSSTTATGRLGVLATHAQAPEVTQTPVHADLLHALQVLTQLAVHTVGQDLAVLAVNNVALSVEEPGWDLVLRWVLHDGDDALEFFRGEIASAALSC